MGRPNPQGSSVAGESYSVVSDASSMVILSMRSQMLAAAMPISSTKPGLMPVPKIDDATALAGVEDALAVAPGCACR